VAEAVTRSLPPLCSLHYCTAITSCPSLHSSCPPPLTVSVSSIACSAASTRISRRRLGQTLAGPLQPSCWLFILFKFLRLIHCFGLISATICNAHQALHCRPRHRRVLLNHQISNTNALNFTRRYPVYFRLILLLIRRSGHMHRHGVVAIAITQRVRTSCAHSFCTTK
jgi:hypothetical protein